MYMFSNYFTLGTSAQVSLNFKEGQAIGLNPKFHSMSRNINSSLLYYGSAKAVVL